MVFDGFMVGGVFFHLLSRAMAGVAQVNGFFRVVHDPSHGVDWVRPSGTTPPKIESLYAGIDRLTYSP